MCITLLDNNNNNYIYSGDKNTDYRAAGIYTCNAQNTKLIFPLIHTPLHNLWDSKVNRKQKFKYILYRSTAFDIFFCAFCAISEKE